MSIGGGGGGEGVNLENGCLVEALSLFLGRLEMFY